MKIEGLKIDCHDCCKVFYVKKEDVGLLEYCPFCLSPDTLAYNEANIYIGKLLEDDNKDK